MPSCEECKQNISITWLLFSTLNNVYSCRKCGSKYKWNSFRTKLTFIVGISAVPFLMLTISGGVPAAVSLFIFFVIAILVMAFTPGQFSKLENDNM